MCTNKHSSKRGAPAKATKAQRDDGDIAVDARMGGDKQSFIFRKMLHKDAKLSKLKTPEDNYHLHKTLGIMSVLSFFYRYAYYYNTHGNLGFNVAFWDITNIDEEKSWLVDAVTIGIHTLLAFSSIIFRVPKKRLPHKPMVIYEEYRQHAMTFTARCSLVWFVAAMLPGGRLFGINMLPIAILACHLVVDRITSVHGTQGNTAVRANSEGLSTLYKFVAKGYSFYQFLAIASQLAPSARTMDMGYNAIIAIQSSAFMMTLYRKRIVRGTTHMAVYSFCLIVSAFHIMRVLGWNTTLVTLAAFVARVNMPRGFWSNKYFLWTSFYTLMHKDFLLSVFGGVQSLQEFKDVLLTNEEILPVVQGVLVAVTLFNFATVEEMIRTKGQAPKQVQPPRTKENKDVNPSKLKTMAAAQ